MAVLQSIIAIMDIIAHNSFLREGIFGLFFILILFHAYHQLSYKAIVIYTFMSLFFSVIFLVYILKMYLCHKIDCRMEPIHQMFKQVGTVTTLLLLPSASFSMFLIPYSTFSLTDNLNLPNFQAIIHSPKLIWTVMWIEIKDKWRIHLGWLRLITITTNNKLISLNGSQKKSPNKQKINQNLTLTYLKLILAKLAEKQVEWRKNRVLNHFQVLELQ